MPKLGSPVTLRCSSLRTASAAAFLLAVGFTAGCGSAAKPAPSDSGSGSAMSSGAKNTNMPAQDNTQDAAAGAMVKEMADDLARRYVVGPLEVDQLGYRVDWNIPSNSSNARIKVAVAAGDSFFVVDRNNVLTRIRRETGDRLWQTAVAEPIEDVHGITRVEEGDRDEVLVTTNSDVWVFDSQNGAFIARHDLLKVGSTAPAKYGPYLIYGSVSGQVVWFQHQVGTQWRAYQLGGAVRQQPIRHRDLIIAVTENGETSAIDVATTERYWRKQTRANVVAPAAVGPRAVYVVSLDQHIYAYDIDTGQVRWFRLTNSPLSAAPVFLNDQLYVYVPSEGLQAFDPMPRDVYYDGVVRWTAEGVSGEVIGLHRGRLLVWDRDARVMSLVSESNGDVIARLHLPKVAKLVVDGMTSGEIYAIGDDGKVLRMVPRN